jgi:Arc/MetJ family transcription regulator
LVELTHPRETPMTDVATNPTTEPDIDPNLLAEAQRQIQVGWPNEAINEALRRLVEQERDKRRTARARLERMSDEGMFDFGRLDAAEE